MATKKYFSKSHVCIQVYTQDRGFVHVSFNPMTGGGSTYVTKDKSIQDALEQHYRFKSLFYLDTVFEEPQQHTVNGRSKSKTADDNSPDDSFQKVPVTCVDDAKDYIADKFGISRSKMRRIESIKAIAAEHNIVFEGI